VFTFFGCPSADTLVSLARVARSVVSVNQCSFFDISSPMVSANHALRNRPLVNRRLVVFLIQNGSLYSLESFQSCVEDELVGSAMSCDGVLSPFAPS